MNKSLSRVLACSLAFGCLILTWAAAGADTVIQDGFTPTGEGRMVGGSLHGVKTEQGSATWSAAPCFQFGGSEQDGFILSSAPGGGSARLPIPAGATSVKLELDFQLDDSSTSRWVGLGIGGGNTKGTFFKEATGMLLCLNDAGYGRFCAGPEGIDIGSPMVGLNPSGPNHLVLLYNIAAQTVSAWINGTPVCTEGTPCPVPIQPECAGFACYGTSPETKIDNFKMTVQGGDAPAAQP